MRNPSLSRRSTSLASFSSYVNWANSIVNPWDLEVTENYKISFFTFQRDLVPGVSLPACPYPNFMCVISRLDMGGDDGVSAYSSALGSR